MLNRQLTASLTFLLMASASLLSASELPACNTHAFARHGDRLEMTTGALGRVLNQRLAAVHSHFSDLQLTTVDGDHLKVSGKKDGTPMAISGPLDAQNGELVLHTDHITSATISTLSEQKTCASKAMTCTPTPMVY